MATTSAGPAIGAEKLQELALRHLWMHFTRMGGYNAEHEIPIIMRGEGPYVFDQHGKRYLDGLSGLFCSNLGHGRTELGEAAARQIEELDFTTLWSYAHPRAIELATKIASLAPGDLNRVFFTSGGSEAVESAIKLARAYHQRTGHPRKIKFISREIAYHGTSLGALAATGITALRTEFEPLVPGGFQVPNTNSYHWPEGRDPLWAADQIEEKIEYEGPETVAAVILEPLQNAGGCIPPQEGYFQRVREICDRHDVLLISDEVICAWGRLGHWFGCQRYDYQPDIMTMAKALTSAYVPMGGMVASDRVAEPFMQGTEMFTHGFTFAGHPVAAAVALANIDIYEREDIPGHVLRKEGEFRSMLEALRDIPIVGDVRGAGFFHAIELVKDQETKEGFTDEESEWLLRGFLSGELYRRGLICRADDRGDPVIQLSPPLICDTEQFEEIEGVLRPVLTEAWEKRTLGRRQVGTGALPVPDADGRGSRLGARARACVRVRARLAADPLGPHLRARGPDAVALRRRAPADHRDPALDPGAPAPLRRPPCRARPGRPRLRDRLHPPAAAEGDSRRVCGARPAPVRGALRDAVHRHHRARLRAAGQRGVRRAPARRPGSRAARAPRHRGQGDRRDPRGHRRGGRRRGGAPGRRRQRDRRGAGRWLGRRAGAAGAGRRRSPPTGRRPRLVPSSRSRRRSPAGRCRSPSRAGAAAPRSAG